MLINDAQDRIMIIDFQESRSLNPCPDVQLRKCTQEDLDEEMKKIKVLIDYDGTRAAYRRRVNREKRIYHREMRQAIKEGERELDEFRGPYGGLPKWLSKENDGEGGEDDDEGGEDDEPLDLDEAELMEDEVYEGFYKGRRFNVPGEEYRKEKRAKDNEVIEKILAMKRAREEKEAAEKAGQLAAGESVEKVAESEPPIAAGPGPSEAVESGAHVSGIEKGASAPAKPTPDGVGDENQPSATVSPKTVGSLPDTQGVPPSKDIISSGSTPVLFGAKGKETLTHDEDDPPKPGPDKKPAAKAGSPKRGFFDLRFDGIHYF
ncbi:hypothetical protein FRB99_006292 [Tulasnella sp. 403]|nr:hypothetical protein FRB99_006292 [Tulasnella sp. 403]